ncbi:MAG: succinate--CoA ligase subunit beta [Alphaproteobacteria bacterium]|nr:succinate--CoA ligase subunit beta [Alphaproteobacteria bacterium]
MNIHEYQAKRIFKKFGVNIPAGLIAYTPTEAKNAANSIASEGPWVVKAQIRAGSRDMGKFLDKRAGKRGGIRLSKTLDEVFSNADDMLENMLITNQTGAKGRLVSRVYVEEYIKTVAKFYVGIAIDRVKASVVVVISKIVDKGCEEFVEFISNDKDSVFMLDIGIEKEIKIAQAQKIADFMQVKTTGKQVKDFINKLLKIFYAVDATEIEINPIGLTKNGEIWALDADIYFDKNALYKHSEIRALTTDEEIEERELIASKFGFQYKELNSGVGIIVNGDGLALNTINEAQNIGMDTACFLNLKGGVDRDKIAAGIKLIMTNPKVDGIFINILGGFLRCNLIADGIITVANDLGLNIPLIIRFEGTNKDEATEILEKSGLSFLIAEDTKSGLYLLKKAIEEDF